MKRLFVSLEPAMQTYLSCHHEIVLLAFTSESKALCFLPLHHFSGPNMSCHSLLDGTQVHFRAVGIHCRIQFLRDSNKFFTGVDQTLAKGHPKLRWWGDPISAEEHTFCNLHPHSPIIFLSNYEPHKHIFNTDCFMIPLYCIWGVSSERGYKM